MRPSNRALKPSPGGVESVSYTVRTSPVFERDCRDSYFSVGEPVANMLPFTGVSVEFRMRASQVRATFLCSEYLSRAKFLVGGRVLNLHKIYHGTAVCP